MFRASPTEQKRCIVENQNTLQSPRKIFLDLFTDHTVIETTATSSVIRKQVQVVRAACIENLLALILKFHIQVLIPVVYLLNRKPLPIVGKTREISHGATGLGVP